MRIAFLFPGQGAKRVHETLRWVTRSEPGRARCEAAARAADVGLDKVIARPSLLDQTQILQPILTAMSLAIVERLAGEGVTPDLVLGHSAGEVAAWAVAEGVSVEQAISLAALRGRLMAREAGLHPGGMVALGTSEQAVIEAALARGRESGALCLAAHNAPDETVLSGDESAVRAVLSSYAALATRIPTSGAWHSPAMNDAVAEWREAVQAVADTLARRVESGAGGRRCAFVANRTGRIEEDMAPLLVDQLTHPVEWHRALSTVRAEAGAVVTIGPGAVMRALWHRCFRRAATTPHHESLRGALSTEPKDPLKDDERATSGAGRTVGVGRRATDDGEATGGAGRTATDDEGATVGVGRSVTEDGGATGEKRLFSTDDERAIGETIAHLKGP